MLFFLLLFCISSVIVLGGKTPEGCTIEEQWTEKFIRFECFEGKGTLLMGKLIVKGVRAIGCVPSNNERGELILPGNTYDDELFTYNCSKTGDLVSYYIINCLDPKGEALLVGEVKTMEDGSIWSCYRDKAGEIKMAQEKSGGCVYNGTIYKNGKTWTRDVELKITVNGVEKVVGKAESMRCVSDGKLGFVAQAYGCVTSTGTWIRPGQYSKIGDDGDFVQCLLKNGAISMRYVPPEEVECDFNGVKIQSGKYYTTKDKDVLYCKFGVCEKKGCEIGGKTRTKNALAVVDGHAYHCWNGVGYFDFGTLTGCTMSDKSIKLFLATWQNGTEFHSCGYLINKGVVSAQILFYGCAYTIGGKTVSIKAGKIGANGAEIKICALDGKVWKMRDLTAIELEEYNKEKVASAKVFGGVGGEGEGGLVTAVPTLPPPAKDGGVLPITDQCRALMDTCTSIAPVCSVPIKASVEQLKAIIKKLNLTADEILKILDKASVDLSIKGIRH